MIALEFLSYKPLRKTSWSLAHVEISFHLDISLLRTFWSLNNIFSGSFIFDDSSLRLLLNSFLLSLNLFSSSRLALTKSSIDNSLEALTPK